MKMLFESYFWDMCSFYSEMEFYSEVETGKVPCQILQNAVVIPFPVASFSCKCRTRKADEWDIIATWVMNYLSRKFIFKTNLAVFLRLAISAKTCECKLSHIPTSSRLCDMGDPTGGNQLCAQLSWRALGSALAETYFLLGKFFPHITPRFGLF